MCSLLLGDVATNNAWAFMAQMVCGRLRAHYPHNGVWTKRTTKTPVVSHVWFEVSKTCVRLPCLWGPWRSCMLAASLPMSLAFRFDSLEDVKNPPKLLGRKTHVVKIDRNCIETPNTKSSEQPLQHFNHFPKKTIRLKTSRTIWNVGN